MALTAEVRQLKAEVTARDETAMAAGGDDRRRDNFGIEGLTIVMHMKGQGDLVINTDLRNAEET